MKLILANNQSQKFTSFYEELQKSSSEPFDYASYSDLLFYFNIDGRALTVYNLAHKKFLADYAGVYINGYLNTYELAASVAITCDELRVGYANQELHNPPSLSKLTMYAKLAAADVSLPPTLGGTKQALMQATEQITSFTFPAVLKRADADRGIDNFKVGSADETFELLASQEERSLWVLQEFVPNNGFYLVSYYDQQAKFSIFRSLEERPDGNEQKAHMYKPKGGANAHLIELADVPPAIIETCTQAVKAMNRQIGSVDCLYDEATNAVYVLEVNYNPQLVTIETFKDVRVQAFLDYLPKLGNKH